MDEDELNRLLGNLHTDKETIKHERPRDRLPSWLKDRIRIVFNNSCFKCDNKGDLVFDHIKPFNVHMVPMKNKNVCLLCRKCNLLKAELEPEDYFTTEELIMLIDLNDKL